MRRSLFALVALVGLGIAAPARADVTFFNDPGFPGVLIESGLPVDCVTVVPFPMDKQAVLAFQKSLNSLQSGQRVTCKRVVGLQTPFGKCGIYSLGGCGKPF